MNSLSIVGGAAAVGVILTLVIDWIRRRRGATEISQANETSRRILEEVRKESEVIRKEAQVQAKDLILNAQKDWEQELKDRRRESQQIERRLEAKEEGIEKRLQSLDRREIENTRREGALREREAALAQKEREQAEVIRATQERLEQVAGMSREEAKKSLLDTMIEQTRYEAAKRIRQVEDEAKEEAERKAKKIIAIAIERLAGDFVAERTVTVVPLPSDDLKGRIIGREGRNIRAIEAATGVDLIVDDTPESVVISCHNPIRREIARLALQKLIADGRIHPGRIEEVVRKAE